MRGGAARPLFPRICRTGSPGESRCRLRGREIATDTIIGFYTLSSFGFRPESLAPDVLRRLPRYDLLPASLLGRLAVDLRYRGQGLGEMLLFNALRRSYDQSAVIGAMAVVVDAKDDAARTFYERYGFRRFLDAEYRLYLPMRTIEQILRATQ